MKKFFQTCIERREIRRDMKQTASILGSNMQHPLPIDELIIGTFATVGTLRRTCPDSLLVRSQDCCRETLLLGAFVAETMAAQTMTQQEAQVFESVFSLKIQLVGEQLYQMPQGMARDRMDVYLYDYVIKKTLTDAYPCIRQHFANMLLRSPGKMPFYLYDIYEAIDLPDKPVCLEQVDQFMDKLVKTIMPVIRDMAK